MNDLVCLFMFFFFNDTATTEIYTLSLHDALPIWSISWRGIVAVAWRPGQVVSSWNAPEVPMAGHSKWKQIKRSEEHTSELQSQSNLVCRLLLEKKKEAPFCSPRPHGISSSQSSLC